MMRVFPIKCDQQTIEQAVLDCLEVDKLLRDLHNRQSSEYETRRIGRVLTACRQIEIFLRAIMKEEFESRNASTMSSNANTMSSNANTMSSNASTMSSNASTMSSNANTMSSNASTMSSNASTMSSDHVSLSVAK